LFIESLNQKEVHDLQRSGNWEAIAETFIDVATRLARTGAEGIALCANTPHKIYDQLVAEIDIPVLHIADAIALKLKQSHWDKVGLIGTAFTMKEDFIKGRLRSLHEVETLVPAIADQSEIQELIYGKLSVGIFDEEAKRLTTGILESLSRGGAEAVILGCTEFPLLLKGASCEIPLIDSIQCHCEMLVQFILGNHDVS